jgi:aquaporin Z
LHFILFFRTGANKNHSTVKEPNMRKYAVEFIGTFFLVCGAILGGPLGASLALMVMIYAGGHISGAHYNPAVTIAMIIRRKIAGMDVAGYILAQLAGASLAALIISYGFDITGIGDCQIADDGIVKSLLAEFISTFALAYVVLNVATTRGTTGNSYYGLAIAATVLGMAIVFGKHSGGVFNPAVALGLVVQKSMCWSQIWIYLVAPIAGAVVAAFVFLGVNEADEEPESIPDDVEVRNGDRTLR